MKKMTLLTLMLGCTGLLQAMNVQSDAEKLTVYAVPGQNGLGSRPEYVQQLLGDSTNIIAVETPQYTADFGQNRCLGYLRKAVNGNAVNNSGKKYLIHATSQGTATAINYVAHEDKNKNISGLILEATLASGNRAIEHTLQGPLNPNLQWVTKLPFSYYWIPYVAKMTTFPFYSPAGKQPIKSISKIPTNIPVIIAHSKYDPQLSYDDACALYYGLCSQGNKQAYLITKPDSDHIELLNADDATLIQNILKNHNLIDFDQQKDSTGKTAINLSRYQPDHTQFKKKYDEILNKEKNHGRLRAFTFFGVCCLIMKFINSYANSCRSAASIVGLCLKK